MTIDEAIEIYEKRAKSIERSFSRGAWADGGHKTSLMEVAADHRQFAEWLRELKGLRNSVGAVKLKDMKEALELIRALEVDVQPVIHAKWILFDRDSVGRAFYCSNCRKVTTTDDYEDTPLDREEYFCTRCGADMRSPDATKG